MNVKALERAFMRELKRLTKNVKKENMHKPHELQFADSMKRLVKEYEKEAGEPFPNPPPDTSEKAPDTTKE